MDLSTFSLITGTFMLLLAIPLLVASEKAYTFIQEVMRDELHLRCFGSAITVIAVATLAQGYAIGTDAPGLIRIVAWLTLAKGITAAWFPGKLVALTHKVFDDAGVRPVLAIVGIAVGGLLLYGSQLV